MLFNCRESCGTCGFKSRKFCQTTIKPNQTNLINQSFGLDRYINSDQYIILGFDTELQIVNGKQYTDITADDFSKFIEYL